MTRAALACAGILVGLAVAAVLGRGHDRTGRGRACAPCDPRVGRGAAVIPAWRRLRGLALVAVILARRTRPSAGVLTRL